MKEGIYAARVKYKEKMYAAALYYGPRLIKQETQAILEIHILDFHAEIYDESIQFEIKDFIRETRNFSSMEAMKKQIEEDVKKIKIILRGNP